MINKIKQFLARLFGINVVIQYSIEKVSFASIPPLERDKFLKILQGLYVSKLSETVNQNDTGLQVKLLIESKYIAQIYQELLSLHKSSK